MNAAERDICIHTYLHEGRSVSISFFFTLPLLLLYELGIQLSGSDFRNAAEVILKDLRFLIGASGVRCIHLIILVLAVALLIRAYQKNVPFFRYFLLMLLESLILALVIGPLLSIFTGSLLLEFPLTGGAEQSMSAKVLLSVGAGVYEEFLFRLLILGGLFLIFSRFFKAPNAYAVVLSVLISAFLFAAYHHLGPYGQPLSPYTFVFRLGAGVVLGSVFIFRGFGVAVYLHVFYDILRDLEPVLDLGS